MTRTYSVGEVCLMLRGEWTIQDLMKHDVENGDQVSLDSFSGVV